MICQQFNGLINKFYKQAFRHSVLPAEGISIKELELRRFFIFIQNNKEHM